MKPSKPTNGAAVAASNAAEKNNGGGGRMAEIDEQILRTFDIKKRLGKGAYGIVWKALDRNTAQTVAVKKIFDAFRNETDAQRTFREVMFLRSFRNHPNIVRLHSIHRAANHMDIYLSFEFMESDLHNVIKRGSILKDIHKRFVMYQLLNATQYIHSGNVIHRDMKPSNVLIDSKCRCKIADFGLARSIGVQQQQQLHQTSLDAAGDAADAITAPCLTDYVATRWYRAPEILVASKRYTMGIDMWSLGCILGEMLLGKPLFPGSCTVNQIERIVGALPRVTEADIASVGGGFGTALLAQGKQAVGRSSGNGLAGQQQHQQPVATLASLDEMLAGAPEDAKELVNALLRLDPMKRLTAKQALCHRYIEQFRNTSPECELAGDIQTPFRDDVQLTVSDYRSKLYEIMHEKSGGYVGRNKLDKKEKDYLESTLTVTTHSNTPANLPHRKPPPTTLHRQPSSRVSLTNYAPVSQHHNNHHHHQNNSNTKTGKLIASTKNGSTCSRVAAAASSNNNNGPPLLQASQTQQQHHHHSQFASSSSLVSQTNHHQPSQHHPNNVNNGPGKPPYRKSAAMNRELLSRLDDVTGNPQHPQHGGKNHRQRISSHHLMMTTAERRKSLDNAATTSIGNNTNSTNNGHHRRPSLDAQTAAHLHSFEATNNHINNTATGKPPLQRFVPSMSKHKLLNVLNNRMAAAPQQQPQAQSRGSMLCFKAPAAVVSTSTGSINNASTTLVSQPSPPSNATAPVASTSTFDVRLRALNEKLSRHSQDQHHHQPARIYNRSTVVDAFRAPQPAGKRHAQHQLHHTAAVAAASMVAPSQSDSAVVLPQNGNTSNNAALLGATMPSGGQSRSKFHLLFRTKSEYGGANLRNYPHATQLSNNNSNGVASSLASNAPKSSLYKQQQQQQQLQHFSMADASGFGGAGGDDGAGYHQQFTQLHAAATGSQAARYHRMKMSAAQSFQHSNNGNEHNASIGYGGGGGGQQSIGGSMVRATDLYKMRPSEMICRE